MKRTVGLNIALWTELVLSLRTLMFTIPVLIIGKTQGDFSLSVSHDNFIVILTVIALIYFVVSFLSLTGFASYKILHIGAGIAVCALTFIFSQKINPVAASYYLPAMWAGIFSLGIITLRRA